MVRYMNTIDTSRKITIPALSDIDCPSDLGGAAGYSASITLLDASLDSRAASLGPRGLTLVLTLGTFFTLLTLGAFLTEG